MPSDSRRSVRRDVVVTGNLKFDVAVDETIHARGLALREAIGRRRPVWLAASTRDGEEVLLLDALLRSQLDHALLLLVPRHPQRFDDVAALVRSRGLACVRRSRACRATYRQARASFSATRWARCSPTARPPTSRSSAAACCRSAARTCSSRWPSACRRSSGRTRSTFADVTESAIEAGAARRVPDAEALLTAIASLLDDPPARARMRDAALEFIQAHRGATERLWAWLAPKIDA